MDLREVTTAEGIATYIEEQAAAGNAEKAQQEIMGLLRTNGKLSTEYIDMIKTMEAQPGDAEIDQILEQAQGIDPNAATIEGAEVDAKKPTVPTADGLAIAESVKYDPKWLGNYGRNRSLGESIESMSRALAEKENYIQSLKTGREDVETNAQRIAKERDELKALVESMKAKTPDVVAPTADPGQQPQAPADFDLPLPPPPLTGADLFDEEKLAAKHKADAEWQAKLVETMRGAMNRPSVSAQAQPVPELEEVRATLAKMKQNEEEARIRRENERVVADQYATANRIIADNPDIFQTRKAMSEIENDYARFLADLAQQAGIQGSIYRIENGREINKFRDDVLALYPKYYDESDPTLRNKATAAGVNAPAPEDMAALSKVARVRRLARESGISDLENAFYLAKGKRDPALFADLEQTNEPEQMTVAKEQELARRRAIESRSGAAREVLPNQGGAIGANDSMKSLAREAALILNNRNKPYTKWDESERATIQAFSDAHPEGKWWEAFEVIKPASRTR